MTNPSQSQRSPRPVATAALTCLLFTGCSGQKPSFPSFGWTGANRTPATKTASESHPEAPTRAAVGLAHVALNEAHSLGAAEELTGSVIQPASAIEAANKPGQPGLAASTDWDEIDAAFSPKPQKTAAAQKQSMAELEQFNQIVTHVEQGESHLGALKASLDQLQRSAPQAVATPPALELTAAEEDDTAVSVRILAAAEQPLPTQSGYPGSAPTAGGAGTDFPWASPGTQAGTNNTTDRVRQLLNNSLELVQQNNLIAARAVAESAQSMLQRTQAVLSPGEVTPQQVLADIKARQQQHELLTASRKPAETPPTNAETPAVKIDLSREFLNASTPRHGQPEVDELQRFAEATVKANAAATLPVITPRTGSGELDPALLQRGQELLADLEPQVQELSNQAIQLPAETQVITLGSISTSPSSQTRWVNGEVSAPESDVPALPPLTLGNSGPSLGSSPSDSAPLLLGPGAQTQTGSSNEADFDEFAAAFGNVTQTDATALDTAPLLIDEAELFTPQAKTSGISPINLTLLIGGIGLGLMLLFRWRR